MESQIQDIVDHLYDGRLAMANPTPSFEARHNKQAQEKIEKVKEKTQILQEWFDKVDALLLECEKK